MGLFPPFLASLCTKADQGERTRESRADPHPTISSRLVRIWQERGDFSALSAASIRAAQDKDGETEEGEGGEKEERPTAQDMRDLQGNMMEQLSFVLLPPFLSFSPPALR